jgi:hypothetical protein
MVYKPRARATYMKCHHNGFNKNTGAALHSANTELFLILKEKKQRKQMQSK